MVNNREIINKNVFAVIIVAALTAVVIYQACMMFSCRIHIAFAREQVEYFDFLESKAPAANREAEILELMQSVETYYPSGTKQVPGSHLDEVVKSRRRKTLNVLKRHHDSLAKSTAR